MTDYPSAIDGPSRLFTPVDAFSSKPLETTATVQILAGDSTISVQSTSGGFASAYGILSIDDELIIYTAKTDTQFTGCQRGAFGTTAAQHAQGVTVRANMVSGFITALQAAVLAIENEIGTTAARNYVRAAGDQTVTGNKTLQDGASFGSGSKAATGLVRLPNAGALKWRKADDSGDLGMALNAQNHIAMDAIVEFASGQTFGAFSYPDATISSKGIVSIDPAGGLAVAAGALSLAASGVAAGTYEKVTVDATGRVTGGAALDVGDLPAHTHVATDIVSGALPFKIQKDGTDIGTRRALNFIEGPRVAITASDDPSNDRVSVIVNTAPPVAGEITNALGYVPANRAGDTLTGPLLISTANATDSPFKASGPGSNLSDQTLLELTASGELILAGGAGNGYRFAELMGASNPSGWSGVIKVKNPAGVTAGYILLYSNP